MEAGAGDSLPMKHSELVKKENGGSFSHGVEIDSAPESFALWLSEIGIVSKLTDNGNDFDVIDACIGYIANNIKVILEVPFDQDFDEKSLFLEAMVTRYDLSIMPPFLASYGEITKEKERELWDKYEDKLSKYLKLWLETPNNQQSIYPVSGFLGYMVTEVFGYKPKSITEDSYIESLYVKNIPLPIMDEIKDKLRLVIYDSFGGKEHFESYAHSLAKAILDELPQK